MSNEVTSALIGAAVAGILTLLGLIIQAYFQRIDLQRRREEHYINNEVEALTTLYKTLVQSRSALLTYPMQHQLKPPHTFTLDDHIEHLQPKMLALNDAIILADLYLTQDAKSRFKDAYDIHRIAYVHYINMVSAESTPPLTEAGLLWNIALLDDDVRLLEKYTEDALAALRPLLNPKSPQMN